jgi:hypothetical protein
MTSTTRGATNVLDLSEFDLGYADIQTAINLSKFFQNPAHLIAVIRLDLPIRPQDRKLLADFMQHHMRIKNPRGRSAFSRLKNPGKSANVKAAAHGVRHAKAELRRKGRRYRADDVVAAFAEKKGIEFETLNNRVRRSSKNRKKSRA